MDRIGRYLVAERLGSGAFATVYRADDPILEMPVAIKVLADHAAGEPTLRSRFINEARVMRKMNSARIATVYDIAELPDGRPYLVMQLAGRGTLHDRLQHVRTQGFSLTSADFLAVIRGLGDALAVIHAGGIVHRDVKPSNILIDVAPGGGSPDQDGEGVLIHRDEFLVLADFGIAKSLAETRRMTVIAGTAAYMAPEQRVVGASIDGRADIYAATVLVAELLDVTVPDVAGPTIDEWPGPSAAIGTALARGMAHDPGTRPSTARDWADDLINALTSIQESIPVSPTSTTDGSALPPTIADPSLHSTTVVLAANSGASHVADRRPDISDSSLSDQTTPARTTTPPPPIKRRRLAVTGLAAALFLGIGVATAFLWPGGPGPTIVGPRELTVGQQGVYYAEVADGTQITWSQPDGKEHRGRVLTINAGQEEAELTIKVQTGAGAESEIKVKVTKADHPSVRILGPVRATTNDKITFTSSVPSEAEIHWIDWSGERRDSHDLIVQLTSPGTLTVTLVAVLKDGSTHQATHTVTVFP